MTQATNQHRPFYGFVIVAALILATGIPLSCGINAAGIFYTSLAHEFETSSGVLSYYTSFLWGAGLISLPFMGRMLDKLPARVCVAGSCLLIAVDFVWLSCMHALWQYFLGAFVMGFGVTMLNLMAPSTIINRWFAKQAGLYIGIVMAFTGIGGLVFSSLGGALILALGWSKTYLIFGALSAITVPITWVLIKSYPRDIGLKPFGEDEIGHISSSAHDPSLNPLEQAEETGLSASQAYRTRPFVTILILCFIMNFCMYTYYIIPSYADQLHIGEAFPMLGALAASAAMGAQTITKFSMGALSDKVPFKGTTVCFLLGACGVILLAFGGGSIALILIGALGYGFFHGTVNVMLPVFTKRSFGDKDYAKIYARVSMAACAASVVNGLICGTIIHFTDNYTIVFLGIAVLMIIAILLMLSLRTHSVLDLERQEQR